MTGRVRPAVADLPAYRPGKGAKQAEAEHGITDAIKLASNETPWSPIPSITDAVASAASEVNRYADHRATALRERLAASAGLTPDRVTVGCGSVGLLQQLLLTYVDPGDEVVFPWRSFEAYPVYTRLVGGRAVHTPLVDHAFDLDAVVDACGERTKLVLLANPNNPTGTAFDVDEARTLLTAIPEDTIVVLDEAYREFLPNGFGDTVPSLLDDFPNLVVLRTFSKAHGLAALRVGYGFGHPDVIASIDKTLAPFAVNGLGQVAALAALDDLESVMERVRIICDERSRVHRTLTEAGWSLPPANANFVYLPTDDRTDDICIGLERLGIVTRPFSREGIRVTIGEAAENDRFLDALSQVASDAT